MSLPPPWAGQTRVDPLYGCWLWTGRRDRDGYGRLTGGRLAHVEAYVAAKGPVPHERTVDHLCRRRHCCRPEHLEAVTRSEQERRKSWRWRVRQKRCPVGHDLKRHAITTPEGGRVCRLCK